MSGTLILCATPIGNLGDAPPRLAEALESADIVYAEDTRRTHTLLNALGVTAELRSYFVGNERERSAELAERLREGRTVALVTDAGTPVVSDPGLTAVRAARQVNATITAIPGPSAVTMALAVSGFSGDRFVFEGFLPRKGADRRSRLTSLAAERRTAVFFTTGTRVQADLADLLEVSGGEREVVVARELTKVFEQVWHGTLGVAPEYWATATRKGEFTIVLAGVEAPESRIEDAVADVIRRIRAGERLTDAAKEVAHSTGFPRSELYARALESS